MFFVFFLNTRYFKLASWTLVLCFYVCELVYIAMIIHSLRCFACQLRLWRYLFFTTNVFKELASRNREKNWSLCKQLFTEYSCKLTVHPLSQKTSWQFRNVCLPYADDVKQLAGVISSSISTKVCHESDMITRFQTYEKFKFFAHQFSSIRNNGVQNACRYECWCGIERVSAAKQSEFCYSS